MASAAVLLIPSIGPAVHAQGATDSVEEIIVTGTRRAERTASDSMVPIDVISAQELENMGTGDMDDMLRTTLPSYNVPRFAIQEGATLVRPATMRGLPPDNSLILINGKRHHRSAVIGGGGGLTAGSQGPDLASIPALAIKQLEVLRDGASAQYGSDAVAGVLNFVLNDASEGLTVEARYGEYGAGDGAAVQLAANAGFALGRDGFANVTLQWRDADGTVRSMQRTDAATLLASGNPEQQASIRQPYTQIFGNPETRDDVNIFLNAATPLTDSQELYFFGNYGSRQTESDFFFRNPNDRGNVYTENGIRAIVDTNIIPGVGGQVSTCPALASPGSGGNGVPLDQAAVAADYAALQGLPANCWALNQVLPGGYTPRFGGDLTDSSGVMGIRGTFGNGMSYDFSGSVGRNEVEFYLKDSWNPSNGPDGVVNGVLKQNFDTGSYTQTETNLNADFVYPIAVSAFASDLNVAFGAEYRNEQFETRLGEEASWEAGDFAVVNPDPLNPNYYSDGVTPLINLSVGSHGFAGFGPQQAGRWDRANTAVYLDLEADVTERLTLGAAVRFEDFEDFGTTTNGKLSGRFAFTDNFAVRGSASTGFRAPTPGQNNLTKITTATVNGELQQRGLIPPTNPIAIALGGAALTPEDATNLSLGLVWNITDTINVTIDGYQIELKDRITTTGTIDITTGTPPASANCPVGLSLPQCLLYLGIPGADSLSSVNFYTNDFDTKTVGADLVATWAPDWGSAGRGSLTAAWNYTKTDVERVGKEVDRNRVSDLEHFNPRNRGIFTYDHFLGELRLTARASYYSDWVEADYTADPTWWKNANPNGAPSPSYTSNCQPAALSGGFEKYTDRCYDGDWIFDLEAGYTFAEKYTVVLGVQNIANTRGPLDKANADGTIGDGNIYSRNTPWDYSGDYWYLRLRADFN
ncbi:MAG TPA: TonB-dependent receptor [Woeseiaceae bacterium]|nr:TonB-dependent receptor [Woeseiaceae bacterium]